MRVCACGCGESIEGAHPKRQYLSDAHRKRPRPAAGAGSKARTTWQDAVAAKLARYDGVDELDRVDALEAARMLDEGGVTGAQHGQLVKQLKGCMAAIEQAAVKVGDPAMAVKGAVEAKRLKLVV